MKMTIKWKIFFVFLAFSLTPLVVVSYINQKETRKLGSVVSEDVRKKMVEITSESLLMTARTYSRTMRRLGFQFKYLLTMLATQAELSLASDPDLEYEVYFSEAFDSPDNPPHGMKTAPGYYRLSDDGRMVTRPVNLLHPVYYLAPGVERTDVQDSIARISQMETTFRQEVEELGKNLQWVYVSLENGLHISYPGHGGYPPDYDPRDQPWYTRAKSGHIMDSKMVWTFPVIDTSSGQVSYTASRVIRSQDGSILGVVGADILMSKVLQQEQLTRLWSSEMRAFFVEHGLNPDTGNAGLRILAGRNYEEEWGSGSDLDWMISEDTDKLAELVAEIGSGNSGYRELVHDGVNALWAYSPVSENRFFIIIVPDSVVMSLPERNRRTVMKHTDTLLYRTGIAALVIIIILAALSFVAARKSTEALLRISRAARNLAAGDFSVRLNMHTGDERDRVIDSFNELGPKLKEHMEMQRSLGFAREVQQNLLPGGPPTISGLDVAGSSVYCDQTGGDYFDYFHTGDAGEQRQAMIVGDVSGHGVPAALLMATARALLRQRATLPGAASDIITDVNQHLSMDTEATGHFMTAFYAEFNMPNRTVRWVRAGHDPAMVYNSGSDSFSELGGSGLALGINEDFAYRQYSAPLEPGQVILIGTDGIWEMHNKEGEMFGKEMIQSTVRENAEKPAAEIQEILTRKLEWFRGDFETEDDITMIIVKVLP